MGDARLKANEDYNRKKKEGFGTATAKLSAETAIIDADVAYKKQEKNINNIIEQRAKTEKNKRIVS